MNSPIQLLLALGLIVAAIALSTWQKLGLEGNLIVATGRAIAQLIVVGYLIAVVFALNSPWAVLAFLLAMGIVVTIVTRNRISQKIPRLLPLIGGSLLVSVALTVGYAYLIVQPDVWYAPQIIIPLTGIILGNAMTGAAIAGERLVSTLNSSRLELETHLSLGATPQQAFSQYRREAIRSGVLPTLNSMTIVGLATVPDLISGQLLGGADPIQATAYQILILLMLAFSTLLTTLLITQGLCRQFFNQASQLVLW
ncbi:ABC transporter permease [Phormidesmis priestleyi]